MSFLITSAAIGGASALYGIGKSVAQGIQANKIDKNNPRPTYEIPQEYLKNVELAKQMAQVGLPQQQYNNQVNNIYRNQASGIQSLNNLGRVGSNVASVVRASNDATNSLNAQDAAARQQNQRFYIGQNQVLGQQRLAKQQYDKFDKYTENFNKAAALRGAANQNLQNGINSASSMATGLASIDNGSDDTVKSLGASNNSIGGVPFGIGAYPNYQGFAYGTLAPGYQQTSQMPYTFFLKR